HDETSCTQTVSRRNIAGIGIDELRKPRCFSAISRERRAFRRRDLRRSDRPELGPLRRLVTALVHVGKGFIGATLENRHFFP
ncbi:hypothetical protein PanWU01x14_014260, partial [Parasponia andersonii]